MKCQPNSVSRLLYHSVVIRTEPSFDKFHRMLKTHHSASLRRNAPSSRFFLPSFVKCITISILSAGKDKLLGQFLFVMKFLNLREVCLKNSRKLPLDDFFLCECPPYLSLTMEVHVLEACTTLPSPKLLNSNVTHLELTNYSLRSDAKLPPFPNLRNVLMYTDTADDIVALVQRARMPLPAVVTQFILILVGHAPSVPSASAQTLLNMTHPVVVLGSYSRVPQSDSLDSLRKLFIGELTKHYFNDKARWRRGARDIWEEAKDVVARRLE